MFVYKTVKPVYAGESGGITQIKNCSRHKSGAFVIANTRNAETCKQSWCVV